MSAKQRRRRAQALVETAMILPVLVLLMLGAADLGRAFVTYRFPFRYTLRPRERRQCHLIALES